MAAFIVALFEEEDGTSFVELSLFIGLAFLAGFGFLYYSAGQFKEVFMSGSMMQF